MLFYLQNHVSIFWNFILWPRYLGKRSLCPWNQPHFWRNSDKTLLSPEQINLKEIWDRFCRRKTVEDDYANINVPPNIPCTILLFKVSAVLQIFFPRKLKFWERQFFSTINVWHSFPYPPIYLFNWSRISIKNIK